MRAAHVGGPDDSTAAVRSGADEGALANCLPHRWSPFCASFLCACSRVRQQVRQAARWPGASLAIAASLASAASSLCVVLLAALVLLRRARQAETMLQLEARRHVLVPLATATKGPGRVPRRSSARGAGPLRAEMARKARARLLRALKQLFCASALCACHCCRQSWLESAKPPPKCRQVSR